MCSVCHYRLCVGNLTFYLFIYFFLLLLCVKSQETLLDHCKVAGITCIVLVSDKEGNYVKVKSLWITARVATNRWAQMVKIILNFFLHFQVKSFERDRQSEKRIPESDLVDHIFQKCRTKYFEERNMRWIHFVFFKFTCLCTRSTRLLSECCPLCLRREIPESLSQNPKGSQLNTTGNCVQLHVWLTASRLRVRLVY